MMKKIIYFDCLNINKKDKSHSNINQKDKSIYVKISFDDLSQRYSSDIEDKDHYFYDIDIKSCQYNINIVKNICSCLDNYFNIPFKVKFQFISDVIERTFKKDVYSYLLFFRNFDINNYHCKKNKQTDCIIFSVLYNNYRENILFRLSNNAHIEQMIEKVNKYLGV